jgi:hypothetical protein
LFLALIFVTASPVARAAATGAEDVAQPPSYPERGFTFKK